MLYFFKRKRQNNIIEEDIKKNASSSLMFKVQTKFSQKMNDYQQHLSNRQKKIVFIIFSSTLSLYFGFILIGSFFPNFNRRPVLPQNHSITTPKDISLPDSLDIELIQQEKAFQKQRNNHNNKQ